jgi:hypothetical protein
MPIEKDPKDRLLLVLQLPQLIKWISH